MGQWTLALKFPGCFYRDNRPGANFAMEADLVTIEVGDLLGHEKGGGSSNPKLKGNISG